MNIIGGSPTRSQFKQSEATLNASFCSRMQIRYPDHYAAVAQQVGSSRVQPKKLECCTRIFYLVINFFTCSAYPNYQVKKQLNFNRPDQAIPYIHRGATNYTNIKLYCQFADERNSIAQHFMFHQMSLKQKLHILDNSLGFK